MDFRTSTSVGLSHKERDNVSGFKKAIWTVLEGLDNLSDLLYPDHIKSVKERDEVDDTFVMFRSHYLYTKLIMMWVLLSVPLWVPSGAFAAVPVMRIVSSLTVPFGVTSAYLYRRGLLSVETGGLLSCFMAVFQLGCGQYYTGGAFSFLSLFFSPMIQVTTLATGKSSGIRVCIVFTAQLLFFLCLQETGHLPHSNRENQDILRKVSVVSSVSSIWTTCLYSYCSEAQWERYVCRIRALGRSAVHVSQAKSTFLAVMSHELRTPLNHVLLCTDALECELGLTTTAPNHTVEGGHYTPSEFSGALRDTAAPDPPLVKGYGGATVGVNTTLECAHLLSTLRTSARHLLDVINDLLDLSKIECGRMEVLKVPVDLVALVESAVRSFAIYADNKRIELSCTFSTLKMPLVMVDAIRLRQILFNLVGNAVKFTNKGEVAVRVSLEAGEVVLEVSDTGVGINANQLQQLFQPFSQAHTLQTKRRFGGTGLGLVISKQLAAMMGGDLSVSSVEGQGSTFSLTFRPEFVDDGVGSPVARSLNLTGYTGVMHRRYSSEDALTDYHDMLSESPDEAARRDQEKSAARSACGEATIGASRGSLYGRRTTRARRRVSLRWVEQPTTNGTKNGGGSLSGVRVLICDDNPLNAKLAAKILEHDGADVIAVHDGHSAIELVCAGEADYDVMLLDLCMPNMDGFDVACAIREHEGTHKTTKRLAILALTAMSLAEARTKALAVGMDDFVTKPFKKAMLVEKIAHFAAPAPSVEVSTWVRGNTVAVA